MNTPFLNLAGLNLPVWALVLLITWTLIWKGLALWKAAQLSQKKWFIALFIVNTFGLLDIFYLFVIAKKYTVKVVEQ